MSWLNRVRAHDRAKKGIDAALELTKRQSEELCGFSRRMGALRDDRVELRVDDLDQPIDHPGKQTCERSESALLREQTELNVLQVAQSGLETRTHAVPDAVKAHSLRRCGDQRILFERQQEDRDDLHRTILSAGNLLFTDPLD